jgi:hypothetical protein
MAQLFHIDNETPDLADWTGSYADEYAEISQSAGASLPGSGGALGLRFIATNGNNAYVWAEAAELAPGATRYLGAFIRSPGATGQETTAVVIQLAGGQVFAMVLFAEDAKLYSSWYADSGVCYSSPLGMYLAPGSWHYVVLACRRASGAAAADGEVSFYVDGELIHASGPLDNYDRCAGATQCRYGRMQCTDFDLSIDFDEMYGSDDAYPTPESDPSGGYYDIFRGVASPAAIDWNSPVGSVPAGSGQAVLAGLGHEIGVDYWYGIRTVSEAGIEECGTQAVACVELDAEGQLLSPPLARPEELTVRLTREGMILLGFSHQVPPGYAAAELFDVFSDGGSGELDLQTPLATVPNAPGRASDHEVCLPAIEFPLKLAVRARSGQRTGPLSSVITVAVEEPSPAIVLSM